MSSVRKKNLKAGRDRRPSRPPLGFLDEPPPGLFPSRDEVFRVFMVVVLAASVAVACHFVAGFRRRQQRPFCDSGDDPQDFCEPCPDHGECIRGRWECLLGYKKKGRRCVEDGEINQKVERLTELIEDYTCGGYAQVLCYETGIIWFPEADILKMLDEHRLKDAGGLENDTWILLNQKAIKAAESSLEIRISFDGTKDVKCPDSLVELHKPYSCQIRQWIRKNALLLAPVSFLITGSIWLSLRIRRKKYISSRAEQLYEQCVDCKEHTLWVEPWVGFSWLRDHLLLPRERKDPVLWKKVEELVLEDSRIDQYPKMIKGEQKVVLEWQVEGYLSSERTTKAAANRAKVPKVKDLHESALQEKQEPNLALSAS
ncbi:unnamed protein product [Spirodela intermedia]|uniref:Man1/Src1-like C-terminal domain-containing protein n=1 Tax=Spirodela intermedia TaxID=51605 RepID=A0A7I8JHY5_SPIIN|nr:unnamed protein product [Spirodela intermedia]CAA6669720.1 unnamed protein product [Spirodela intermedia]